MIKHTFYKSFSAFFIAGLCLLAASPVLAHRLNIFAWLENDTVLVECNYGKNSPAKATPISIMDSDTGRILLQGKTDANGRFAFKVPAVVREGHGLMIDVADDQGHRNEWIMDASELYAAASLTAGFDQAAIESRRNQPQATQNADSYPAVPQTTNQEGNLEGNREGNAIYVPVEPDSTSIRPQISLEEDPINLSASGDALKSQPLTHEHVRTIVSEELEKHLSPLRKNLAEQSSKEPGIAEIVGGIGWIIGMIGIYLYIRARRKQ